MERKPVEYYLELEYPYTVVPDDGSYFVSFPDLPGCMTQVENPADIAAMADEIRTLWIEGEYEDGQDIPMPRSDDQYSGKFVVRMPKRLHRNLAETADREGVSLNAFVNYLLAEGHARDASRETRNPSQGSIIDSNSTGGVGSGSNGQRPPQLTVVRHLRRVS